MKFSPSTSPLLSMFAGQVCEECGAEATVMQEDEEENRKFFCEGHAPIKFKWWGEDGNDK